MTNTESAVPDLGAPPAWAQGLMTWLVPLSSEESIPGDLLEEYRESVRPSRGPWRANLWYFSQMAGFLFRLAWLFVVLNAAALILRSIFDTFAPPWWFELHSYPFRTSGSGYAAILTFFLAGVYAGSRMGRANSGTLVAVTASAVGSALAFGFQLVLFYTVIQHDRAKLNLFYVTGGFGELITMSVVITVISAPLGLFGGFCGEYMSRLSGRRRATRPSA